MANELNISNILKDALIQWSGNNKEQLTYFSAPHGLIEVCSKKTASFRLTSEDFENSNDIHALLDNEHMFVYEPVLDEADSKTAVSIPAMLSLDMAYRISGRIRFTLHADVIRRECLENENFFSGLRMLNSRLYDSINSMETDSAKKIFALTREKEDWNFDTSYNISAEVHEILRNLFDAKIVVLERTSL